eukprot:2460986-Pyramimonas_sp.AAC.1
MDTGVNRHRCVLGHSEAPRSRSCVIASHYYKYINKMVYLLRAGELGQLRDALPPGLLPARPACAGVTQSSRCTRRETPRCDTIVTLPTPGDP